MMGNPLRAAALRNDLHVLLARHPAQICRACMQQRPVRLHPTRLR